MKASAEEICRVMAAKPPKLRGGAPDTGSSLKFQQLVARGAR